MKEIAKSQAADEVRMRIQGALPTTTLRPAGEEAGEIEDGIQTAITVYREQLMSADIARVATEARHEVEVILAAGQELERFRGKKILRRFYQDYQLARTGLGWNAFVTEVARNAAGAERTRELTCKATERIRLYFPKQVIGLLEALSPTRPHPGYWRNVEKNGALWELGNPTADSREALRDQLLQVARNARANGDAAGGELMRYAVAISTVS